MAAKNESVPADVRATMIEVPEKGGRSKQVEQGRFNYDEHRCVVPPLDLVMLASLYDRNVAHKACCDAKAYNGVGLGYEILPVEEDEEVDREEGQRVAAWLEGMAKRDLKTFTEVLLAAKLDEETVGFGAVEISRNGKGEPDGVYHVPAYTLRRRQHKDGWVQRVEERYTYFLDYPLQAEDVVRRAKERGYVDADSVRTAFKDSNQLIVFGTPSPTSPFYPLPDHVPAIGAIVGDEAAEEYQLDFFQNNAAPRFAILVHGGKLDEGTKEYLLEYLKSAVRGSSQRTLLLETQGPDTKVELQPLNAHERQDAAFVGYRFSTVKYVIMAHRVSPSKVTIVENANLANSRDQDKTFKEQVCKPMQERWEARIQWLLDEVGMGSKWRFRFQEMDLADEEQIARTERIYHPAMLVNEVRRSRGLDPFTEKSTLDPTLVEWGSRPMGSALPEGEDSAGGWAASQDIEDQQEPLSAAKKRVAAEHVDFVGKARELGYVIDAIVENVA